MVRAVDGLLLDEAGVLTAVDVDRAGVLDADADRDAGTEIGWAGNAVALREGVVGTSHRGPGSIRWLLGRGCRTRGSRLGC